MTHVSKRFAIPRPGQRLATYGTRAKCGTQTDSGWHVDERHYVVKIRNYGGTRNTIRKRGGTAISKGCRLLDQAIQIESATDFFTNIFDSKQHAVNWLWFAYGREFLKN